MKGLARADSRPPQTQQKAPRYSLRHFVPFALGAVLLLALHRQFSATTFLPPPFLASLYDTPSSPHQPKVGPRRFPSLYHGRGCNSTELIAAVGRARIREDGASRVEYVQREGLGENELDLDRFGFSYDGTCLPFQRATGDHYPCSRPEVCSQSRVVQLRTPSRQLRRATCCRHLVAFSPKATLVRLDFAACARQPAPRLTFRFRTVMRQFTQGLFILLSNSFAIAKDLDLLCTGNSIFTNGKYCKTVSIFDSRELEHVCSEEPFVAYDQMCVLDRCPPPRFFDRACTQLEVLARAGGARQG